MPVKSKEGKFLGLFDRTKKIQVARLNTFGCIPRGLPRIRHTGESRYPENPTGFRVKHGMTV